MVEVFKTNVEGAEEAQTVALSIMNRFDGYFVTFDLDDCDRVLRIQSQEALIDISEIVGIAKSLGVSAEPLPDDVPHPELV